MRIGSFGYLTKLGWKNMASNKLMTFASIGVLTACLVITGLAALVSVNLSSIIEYFGDQNELRVFVQEGTADERGRAIKAEIENMPNIQEVTYVSQQDALDEMKSLLEDKGDLLDDYPDIFPINIKVTVSDLNFIGQTEERLLNIPEVYRVRTPSELAGVMVSVKNGANYGGWALLVVLGLVSVIVISNTIRLTVFARRRDISIMKYVGATNSFIRLPFFVEGITVGLLSGALAAGLVCTIYYIFVDFFTNSDNLWLLSFIDRLYTFDSIWKIIVLGFLAFGAFVGGVGTTSSIKRHLKV